MTRSFSEESGETKMVVRELDGRLTEISALAATQSDQILDLRAELAAARAAKDLWHSRFCSAVAWIMVLVAIDLSAIAIVLTVWRR